MKVVTYSRVSTLSQDFERQVKELNEYAVKHGFEVVENFYEKVSGANKNEDRIELTRMVEFVKANDIDKVICWEMSRIGRNTLEVLKTIEILNENKISLFIKNYNLETLDDKGNKNPLSTLMVQILSSIAEMEKTQIRERMVSGYNNYRAKGLKVGRKPGYTKPNKDFLAEYNDVVKYLNKGRSVRETMKLTGRSNGTIMKVKKLLTE